MGSLRRIKNRDGSVRWRAEVYVRGTRDSARFATKPEAVDWIQTREATLERRAGIESGRTMRHLFLRYADEVSPTKKGARWEVVRLKKFGRDPIAQVPLLDLNLDDADAFCARAALTLKPGSIIRELNLLKTVVRRGVRWRWLPAYPWEGLEGPRRPRGRDRFITDEEMAALVETANAANGERIVTVTQQVGILALLGEATAMRLGEMCALEWHHVDLARRVAHLPDSKSGHPRDVPLSTAAVALLERMPRDRDTVFSVNSQTASVLFGRIRRKAGLSGFTFHDIRHRAITLLVDRLNPPEVARMVGHSDLRQLMTYFNKSAEDIASKLG